MSPRKDSPLTIEYLLLGLLDQGPNHGYHLYKELDRFEGVRLVWHIKQGKLYALLDRLESDGLLKAKLISNQEYPTRKEYSLTDHGRMVYQDWIHSPVKHGREMRQDFLARLYFARTSGKEAARRLLEEQFANCLKWLAEFQVKSDEMDESRDYERAVFQFRMMQTEAMMKWLNNQINELR